MQNRKLNHLIYLARHRWLTTNNVVLTIALLIAGSWAISSVQAVERNYQLQKVIDGKKRELQLSELQADTLRFEQRYYNSDEYKTLELKRRLGLALPGEKVLILPPNSERALAVDRESGRVVNVAPVRQTPFQQWMDFLFGDKPEISE